MRRRSLLVSLLIVLALGWCMNAYADAGKPNTFFWDLLNGVGGFFYSALPWNWGSWAGPN